MSTFPNIEYSSSDVNPLMRYIFVQNPRRGIYHFYSTTKIAKSSKENAFQQFNWSHFEDNLERFPTISFLLISTNTIKFFFVFLLGNDSAGKITIYSFYRVLICIGSITPVLYIAGINLSYLFFLFLFFSFSFFNIVWYKRSKVLIISICTLEYKVVFLAK